ncbi:MAG: hypothetical protein H0U46_02280 [Actinobacteria bacterium]|nr:hypothetical protein [Actinomycetota bacterium]
MRRRKSRRIRERKPRIVTRFARFVRELFSSTPPEEELWNDTEGGLGVREPRRPLQPTRSGAVALEAPPDELRDVWAVGEADSR